MDPRNPQKRLRDCTYCVQQDMAGGAVPAGGPPSMSPTPGADPSANPMAVAAAQGGGWGGHVGEGFWHVDPARCPLSRPLQTAVQRLTKVLTILNQIWPKS